MLSTLLADGSSRTGRRYRFGAHTLELVSSASSAVLVEPYAEAMHSLRSATRAAAHLRDMLVCLSAHRGESSAT